MTVPCENDGRRSADVMVNDFFDSNLKNKTFRQCFHWVKIERDIISSCVSISPMGV